MGGIGRFIKLPSHKRFEYTPRYWDPVKEEREARIRQIKAEMGVDVGSHPNRSTIKRGSFRQAQKNARVRATRGSNIRLVVILALLLIIFYFIFLA